VPALKVGEAAGLIASPLIDAHGYVTGTHVAAKTGKDLLAGVHILSYNKIIFDTTAAPA
jgi:hypothetical protein